MSELGYRPHISILPLEEGGGYLIEFPDLPGCISDGDTIDEAIANGRDAIFCWIETAKQHDDEIPPPKPSLLNSQRLENGGKQEENPSSITRDKVIYQDESFATQTQTWEFNWTVTASATK